MKFAILRAYDTVDNYVSSRLAFKISVKVNEEIHERTLKIKRYRSRKRETSRLAPFKPF